MEITPLQWYAGVAEEMRNKLFLKIITPMEYYEKLTAALKTAMEQENKYSEQDVQNVLDGFTNEAPGEYIKTNFIGLLNKQRI